MSNATLRRPDGLPFFLTPHETADLLRITRKALYVMIERRTIPGVIRRSRRRIVFDTDVLLQWLRQQSAPSAAREGAA